MRLSWRWGKLATNRELWGRRFVKLSAEGRTEFGGLPSRVPNVNVSNKRILRNTKIPHGLLPLMEIHTNEPVLQPNPNVNFNDLSSCQHDILYRIS